MHPDFYTPECFLGIATAGYYFAPMNTDGDEVYADRVTSPGFIGKVIPMDGAVKTFMDEPLKLRAMQTITEEFDVKELNSICNQIAVPPYAFDGGEFCKRASMYECVSLFLNRSEGHIIWQ